jgi:hypothetical protein
LAEALFCPDKELLNILTSLKALDARNIHMAVLYSGLLTFYYSILLNG